MATDIAQANITNLAPESHPKVDDVVGNAKHAEVVRALISAFDNKEVADHFSDEIKNMAKTTREIKRGFEQISQDLKPFDDRNFKKADGSPVGQLRPIWDGYYEEYKTLLRTSKNDAMDLKLICDHYLEVVVPALGDKTVTAEELKDIAEDYKTQTTPHVRLSKYYSDSFGALSRKLTDFKTTIGGALKDAEGGVDADIARLEGEVTKLKDEISKHREAINNLVKKAEEEERAWEERDQERRHSFGYRIASLFRLVAPNAVKPHFLDASHQERSQNEEAIRNKESEIVPRENQIADLKRQKHDFPELQKTMGGYYGQIDSIASKVGAFGEFWNAVNVDAEMIVKKLDSAMAANSSHGTYALRKHLGEKGVASLYESLRQALVHYTFEANV